MFAEYVSRTLGHNHSRGRTTAQEVRQRLLLGQALLASCADAGISATYRQAEDEGLGHNYIATSMAMARRFGTTPERVEHLPMAAIRVLSEIGVSDAQVHDVLARIERGDLAPKVYDITTCVHSRGMHVEVEPAIPAPSVQSPARDMTPLLRLVLGETHRLLDGLKQQEMHVRRSIEQIEWLLAECETAEPSEVLV